ncbi:MAG: hypothetical protein OXG23_13340, partial [Chloroflexi bacterium]|nr:hypothetical protein [Chloroflexota bacterium]
MLSYSSILYACRRPAESVGLVAELDVAWQQGTAYTGRRQLVEARKSMSNEYAFDEGTDRLLSGERLH